MRRLTVLVAVAALAAPASQAAATPTVFAASSLTEVLPRIDDGARYSFAGSDTLAAQIREGAPADVFASASPKYTRALAREGLVGTPRFLAFNRLAVIVPRDNPAGIRSVSDLRREGVRLVVAGPSVPAGAAAVRVLTRLGLTAALDNVVSREPDVKSVVAKVALGEADAGLAYATDARAASPEVAGIAIPAAGRPRVRYEIAVVRGTSDARAARAFVARVTGPAGRRELRRAGFIVPAPRARR